MTPSEFHMFLDRFEREVIVNGIEKKKYKPFIKVCSTSISQGKLFDTDFGRSIGESINTDMILTIDYYGYLKKSKGFLDYIKNLDTHVKKIDSHMIYFASIKIEDIVRVVDEIDLIASFPKLKDQILTHRGFKKK